jgi:hypothetical protein
MGAAMSYFIDYLKPYLPGRSVRSLADMTPRLVSLGNNCATKYQIARHLYFRLRPFDGMSRFRAALFGRERKKARIDFDANLFDWQVTPFSSVIECIRRDFQGIFEHADLEINAGHHVENRRLHIEYTHAFHPPGERLIRRDIDQQYPAARQKIDHLINKFRKILQSNGPVVYLHFCAQPPEPDQVRSFMDCVRQSNRRQVFHLALIGVEGRYAAPDLSALCEDVSWHLVAPCSKPESARWEEDDESWGRALDAITRHRPRASSRLWQG